MSADVVRGGATTASAHTLYDIVRKLPDGAQVQLEFGEGDGRLTLSAGRSKFQLQALAARRFSDDGGRHACRTSFRCRRRDLAELIDKTRFAVSTEETRYYLNGIYLHAQAEKSKTFLRAVATDGHRLARYRACGAEGRGRDSGHHHSAQDGQRSAQAARGYRRRGRDFGLGHQDQVRRRLA